ncbi:MAG: ribonuclease III [Mycoplasmataceae bacterium]|nr:ribonuclease III [Mycoplasmataceae bacterium]
MIKKILNDCGINPTEMNMFEEAFTHPSFVNENKDAKQYQRLEFLGDAVLQLYATMKIYKRYPNLNEGEMSIMRASVVNSIQLAVFSEELGFPKAIRFGKSAKNLEENVKIKADIFEAVVGAIYLDLGRGVLIEFLDKTVFEFIKQSKGVVVKNPKTQLQEFLQSESRGTVKYEVKDKDKQFECVVRQDGKKYGVGFGNTKKEAEIAAAENALEKVSDQNETN